MLFVIKFSRFDDEIKDERCTALPFPLAQPLVEKARMKGEKRKRYKPR
jgi:hypothetical protein